MRERSYVHAGRGEVLPYLGFVALAAAVSGRQHFARIEALARTPCVAHAALRLEVIGAEDPLHVGALLETDAVLAGDRSAGVDAETHDRPAEVEHFLRGA